MLALEDKVVYCKAVSAADYWAAASLIASEYLRKGYLPRADERAVRRIQSELVHCDVFLARQDGRVLTTLSLMDADYLPMDAVFGRELDALRAQGLRPIEIGKCAGRSTRTVVTALMGEAFRYSLRLTADLYVATVNPKHAYFYTHGAGFDFLAKGESRPYPTVSGALAIGIAASRESVLASRLARTAGF